MRINIKYNCNYFSRLEKDEKDKDKEKKKKGQEKEFVIVYPEGRRKRSPVLMKEQAI